jgi:ATP-dependent 26S proteasome regulatory subunit
LAKARSFRPRSYPNQSKPFSCIFFIDEIDGLQRNRSGIGNGEEDRFMNDFLAAITDPQNSDILFIGATNFIEKIDPALQRDGRLVPIEFKLPSEEVRTELLNTILAKYKITESFNLKDLLKKTERLSPATLEEIIKRAKRTTVIETKDGVSCSFFEELEKLLDQRKQEESQRDPLPENVQGMYS